MARNQVDPARRPDGRFPVLKRHQKERRKRHGFPGHQEQEGVARQDDPYHAGHEQVVMKPAQGNPLRVAMPLEIGGAVNRAQRPKACNGDQKNRRQRVKRKMQRAARHGPRDLQRFRPAAHKRLKPRDATADAARYRRRHARPRRPDRRALRQDHQNAAQHQRREGNQ